MVKHSQKQKHTEWVESALDRYERPLTRYALRLLGDMEMARDAVQHTFLRLCDAQREEISGYLAAWLYTVCRNKAVDLLRSRQHDRPLGSRSENGTGKEGQASEPASRDGDPAAAVESADLVSWLRQLVCELPERQREVIDLLLDGFTYDQIAEITGRSTGNVRVIAHRAIARLRNDPRVKATLLPGAQRSACGITSDNSTVRTSL